MAELAAINAPMDISLRVVTTKHIILTYNTIWVSKTWLLVQKMWFTYRKGHKIWNKPHFVHIFGKLATNLTQLWNPQVVSDKTSGGCFIITIHFTANQDCVSEYQSLIVIL